MAACGCAGVRPDQVVSLHARIGGSVAQITASADVCQLQPNDRVMVVLKGEQFEDDELLPRFNPDNILEDSITIHDR